MDGLYAGDPDQQSALSLLGAHVNKVMGETSQSDPQDDDTPQASVETEVEKPVKSKGVAKAKKEKPQDVLPPDLISQATHEIENLDAAGARKMASELIEAGEFENFRLGGVFAVVNQHKFFTDYGHADFKAWVEAEYGMKYRKAMYLASVYEYVVELKLPYDKVKHLGWTKLKTLLNPNNPFVTADNIDEWVKKAESLTVLQLEDHIKAKTGDNQAAIEGDAGKTITTITFKLHSDQKDTVREALERAKEQSGTQFDTVALEMIALDYLGKPTGTPVPNSPKNVGLEEISSALKNMGLMPALEVIGKLFPDIDINVGVPADQFSGEDTPDEL